METQIDRLIPPNEGMRIVGVKSPTTYYQLIRIGELPPLIKRGRNSFHLESDLRVYVARLAASRGAA
jgi:predicted DNA-binding transcriptional regulator AlpA